MKNSLKEDDLLLNTVLKMSQDIMQSQYEGSNNVNMKRNMSASNFDTELLKSYGAVQSYMHLPERYHELNIESDYKDLHGFNVNILKILPYNQPLIQQFGEMAQEVATLQFETKKTLRRKENVKIFQYTRNQPAQLRLVETQKYIVVRLNKQTYQIILQLQPDDYNSNFTAQIKDDDETHFYTVLLTYFMPAYNVQYYFSLLKQNRVVSNLQTQFVKINDILFQNAFIEIHLKQQQYSILIRQQNGDRLQKVLVSDISLKILSKTVCIIESQNHYIFIKSDGNDICLLMQLVVLIQKKQIWLNDLLPSQNQVDGQVQLKNYLFSMNETGNLIIKDNAKNRRVFTIQHPSFPSYKQQIYNLDEVSQFASQCTLIFNNNYSVFQFNNIIKPETFQQINFTCTDQNNVEFTVSYVSGSNQLKFNANMMETIVISSRNAEFSFARFIFISPRIQIKYHDQIHCFLFKENNEFILVAQCLIHFMSQFTTDQNFDEQSSSSYSYSYSMSEDDIPMRVKRRPQVTNTVKEPLEYKEIEEKQENESSKSEQEKEEQKQEDDEENQEAEDQK